MKYSRLLFWGLCLIGLGSCDHVCPPAVLNMLFKGYTLSEIDTLVVKKYQKNSGFTVLKETYTVRKLNNKFVYAENADSIGVISITLDSDLYQYLESGYDWEISILTQPRTVQISNIIVDQTEDRSKRCRSPIASYVQDGQFRIPLNTDTDISRFHYGGYWVVIEK